MTELGKIEKPEIQSFREKRKLYVVPVLPFEEMGMQFKIDTPKVERFWGEVKEKLDYFVGTYGKISIIFLEGINQDKKAGIDFFENLGKESNHYKLMKSLVDSGAVIRGIEKEDHIERSKLLFEEYSKSFLPGIEELHKGFFGKDIDFNGWRDYLVKKIQETQDDMSRLTSKIIGETLAENGNSVLFITEGRPIEFPAGIDVFQVRPPAFDELVRKLREKMS
jgi:hypothetical protein